MKNIIYKKIDLFFKNYCIRIIQTITMESIPTYQQVIACKQLTDEQLKKEWTKLTKFKPTTNKNCFAGNPILYHYQLDNLCQVKLKTGSFKDIMDDEERCRDTWEKCNKYANGSRPDNAPLRLFELWRRMNGAIVFFKPTVAMYMYNRFKATAVLDPTAGWGGRMMAAAAMDIKYTGIDTNTNMTGAYEGIMNLIQKDNVKMIWQDALTVDFSEIDYDFVLTSPPYVNLELYEKMTPYESKEAFYKKFLIPLINKCRGSIRRNGKVCINIDVKMYNDLLKFGYEACSETHDMFQQKVQGKNKGQKIYVW